MSNCSEETLDDIDGIEPEGSGLEIVTECWVEPQDGTAVTKSQRLRHFNNLDYKQLLESVCIVSYLETFYTHLLSSRVLIFHRHGYNSFIQEFVKHPFKSPTHLIL